MLRAYVWFQTKMACQKGQGMTEYGLILALIAVVLIVVMTALGSGLQGKFAEICKAITGSTCKIK